MTKAYFVNHENVVIDETGKLSSLKTISTNIDWIYIAPEDMEITYSNCEKDQETKSVKKGDIIIQMYNNPSIEGYKHIIVVTSDEWKNNLELYDNRNTLKGKCINQECDECSSTEMCDSAE